MLITRNTIRTTRWRHSWCCKAFRICRHACGWIQWNVLVVSNILYCAENSYNAYFFYLLPWDLSRCHRYFQLVRVGHLEDMLQPKDSWSKFGFGLASDNVSEMLLLYNIICQFPIWKAKSDYINKIFHTWWLTAVNSTNLNIAEIDNDGWRNARIYIWITV